MENLDKITFAFNFLYIIAGLTTLHIAYRVKPEIKIPLIWLKTAGWMFLLGGILLIIDELKGLW